MQNSHFRFVHCLNEVGCIITTERKNAKGHKCKVFKLTWKKKNNHGRELMKNKEIWDKKLRTKTSR